MKRSFTQIALIVCAIWVFYNTIFSGSILYFDALGYEQLGKTLAHGQWIEYLSAGPSREPLYPLFVAFNMRAADLMRIPYLQLLLLTQGLILLTAQLMMAGIFRRIELSDKLSAFLLVCFVLSPTVLRASLIVYSEIVTFPLMLLPCLAALYVWQGVSTAGNFARHHKKYALILGGSFLPIMFVKGIFEMIAPVCIVLVTIALWARFRAKNATLRHMMIFLVIGLTIFAVPVNAYKMLNKIFNGNFVFTNRGSGALYGTTARRVLPTTPQEELAQKLYVLPDKSICDQYAGKDACAHWFYHLSDQIGADMYETLRAKNVPVKEIDKQFTFLSFKLMRAHPFKTMKGMFWEGAKLLFWEYPSWGMVILPRDVRYVYEQPFLYSAYLYGVNGISVIFFILSIVCAGWYWRRFLTGQDRALNCLVITLMLIMVYSAVHSFFFLNERNALPIVPLFIVLYGSFLKCIWPQRKI